MKHWNNVENDSSSLIALSTLKITNLLTIIYHAIYFIKTTYYNFIGRGGEIILNYTMFEMCLACNQRNEGQII